MFMVPSSPVGRGIVADSEGKGSARIAAWDGCGAGNGREWTQDGGPGGIALACYRKETTALHSFSSLRDGAGPFGTKPVRWAQAEAALPAPAGGLVNGEAVR